MDIKISGIGFQGKKEVLYGLTKAAKIARVSEQTDKAYITSRMAMTKYEEMAAYDASMKAYMDMVIKDSGFKSVAKNANDKDLSVIKEILAPKQTEHGLVEPIKKFSETLNTVINNNYKSKAKTKAMCSVADELLQKLKS